MYNNTCIYNIAYQVILVTVGSSMQTLFTYIAMKGKTNRNLVSGVYDQLRRAANCHDDLSIING